MSAATRTEPVQLADGRALRMTFAQPHGVVRGGVVVLHEERGITQTMRALVSGLADEGWLTVAPHIYDGDSTELDADTARDRASTLPAHSVRLHTPSARRALAPLCLA